MYEKLYTPLPDTGAYLHRLDLNDPEHTDLAFLDTLIIAHQRRIPFENLDTWLYHIPVSLEIPALFDKIVSRNRGGYCFELNALFTCLLQALGYHATACMCRICGDNYIVPPVSHRAVLVELDGTLHFCDVGFGGPTPPGSVPVTDGSIRFFGTEAFSIQRYDHWWWTLRRRNSEGVWQNVLQFYTMPQDNVDFISLNRFYSTSPVSSFTQKPYLNIRTKDGSCSLVGDTFTRHTSGETTRREVRSQDDFFQFLRNYFRLPV